MPHAVLPRSSILNKFGNCVQTTVEVLHRRAKGETDEMVAWRVEQVTTMRGIDIKENSRNDNGLLFEQFLEKCLEHGKLRCGHIFISIVLPARC